MFQNAGRSGAVGKELAAVFLRGDGETDCVFRHCNGAVTDKPVEAQSGDMQHVRGMERDGIAAVLRKFVLRLLVGVIQLSVLVPADSHFVRHQRVQSNDLALAVTDDLRIGVAPQEQMRHERLTENKGAHLRVRLVM